MLGLNTTFVEGTKEEGGERIKGTAKKEVKPVGKEDEKESSYGDDWKK